MAGQRQWEHTIAVRRNVRLRRLSTIASGEVAAGGSGVRRMRRGEKLGEAAKPTGVSNENAVNQA